MANETRGPALTIPKREQGDFQIETLGGVAGGQDNGPTLSKTVLCGVGDLVVAAAVPHALPQLSSQSLIVQGLDPVPGQTKAGDATDMIGTEQARHSATYHHRIEGSTRRDCA